ncbi:TPA: hypothetical protein ACX1YF_004205 [Salmonella enterica subsp. enterica serovar Infantis]
MNGWRVLGRALHIIVALVAGLVGLVVALVWAAGVVGVYAAVAAVFLKLLHIPSIFDTYFPGMTVAKWFSLVVILSLMPAVIQGASSLLDSIEEWRDSRIRRRYAAGVVESIAQEKTKK